MPGSPAGSSDIPRCGCAARRGAASPSSATPATCSSSIARASTRCGSWAKPDTGPELCALLAREGTRRAAPRRSRLLRDLEAHAILRRVAPDAPPLPCRSPGRGPGHRRRRPEPARPDRRPLGRDLSLQPELRVLLRRERTRARAGARPGGPPPDRRAAGGLGRARGRHRRRRAHRAPRPARAAGRDPRRRDGAQRDDQRHDPPPRRSSRPWRRTPAWSTSRPTGRTGSTPPAGPGSSTGSAGRLASWPRPAPGWASTCCSRPTTCTTSARSLDEALDLGARGITLLRPKGEWARANWPGFPSADDLDAAAAGIRAFVASRPAVRLYVDTALRGEWAELGLFEDPEPDVAGCGGGQRHVAVTPEGDVFPCSHARVPDYRMGNLLTD